MLRRLTFLLCAGLLFRFGPGRLAGEDSAGVDAQLKALSEQNRLLQAQVAAQQRAIDALQARVAALDQAAAQNQASARTPAPTPAPAEADRASPTSSSEPILPSIGNANVRISGEAGFAFFLSGTDGPYQNGDFRWDDAKLFLDAAMARDIYFYSELDLITRETTDQNLHFGEMYVDFENFSALWDGERTMTLRAGRFYIPFGEEYQVRGVMEDPLVSHSVSDIWGMDQGLEVYGQKGPASYALAVTDGGIKTLGTAHSDKAVAARVGYDTGHGVHLSASAMRTGRLSPSGDSLSAVWFGNGFFRALGPPSSTSDFHADLEEADASLRWSDGEVKAAGGLVQFNDNAPGGADARHMSYYYAEVTQRLADRLNGAVRFSGIQAPGGFPLAGQGSLGEYFFANELTTELRRLSLGLCYQFSPPVEVKIDYSPEWGRTTQGGNRDREDLFATELGIKF